MSTDAVKVALDVLREGGADEDLVRWLEHPEAVRELLKYRPAVANRVTDESDCAGWLGGVRGAQSRVSCGWCLGEAGRPTASSTGT